jgi:hypothetical protein
MAKRQKSKIKIGLSVSRCVYDILKGRIAYKNVRRIVSCTMARGKKQWDEVIAIYRNSTWSDNPDKGERIVRRLLAEKKIRQPRLANPSRFPLTPGRKIWVRSEREIRWSTGREEFLC